MAESLLGDCAGLAWDPRVALGEGVVQGHPQWRRKVMIVGLAFEFGMDSCAEEGAFAPTAGETSGVVSSFAGLVADRVSSSFEVIVGT